MSEQKHTPGPWEYIASTEHHGAYVSGPYGGDICDCYTMSNIREPSVRNGGTSYPIPHQGEAADANARLIAAAPAQSIIIDLIRFGLARFEGREFCFDGLRYSHDGDWSALVGLIGWEQCRAAIAKAQP